MIGVPTLATLIRPSTDFGGAHTFIRPSCPSPPMGARSVMRYGFQGEEVRVPYLGEIVSGMERDWSPLGPRERRADLHRER